MKRIDITSAKLAVVFPAGQLPAIKPGDPAFVLDLGGVEIRGKINPRTACKLAQHPGEAILQGKLIANGGKLRLLEAGFQLLDPKPAGPPAAPAGKPGPAATTAEWR
jgi:hypothetical protein